MPKNGQFWWFLGNATFLEIFNHCDPAAKRDLWKSLIALCQDSKSSHFTTIYLPRRILAQKVRWDIHFTTSQCLKIIWKVSKVSIYFINVKKLLISNFTSISDPECSGGESAQIQEINVFFQSFTVMIGWAKFFRLNCTLDIGCRIDSLFQIFNLDPNISRCI